MQPIDLTAQIVAAYVSKNPVPAAELPGLIKSVSATLSGIDQNKPDGEPRKPAVSIARSITPEHLICLEDGAKLKMLKRYLRSRHNLTPEQYRERWGLKRDYPMVAPNYSATRSAFAKKIGLGRTSSATKRKRAH